MKTCLNCGKTEQEIPLFHLSYQSAEVNICPQCLPVLVHKPASLDGKLPGLKAIQPARHDHD